MFPVRGLLQTELVADRAGSEERRDQFAGIGAMAGADLLCKEVLNVLAKAIVMLKIYRLLPGLTRCV